MRTKGHYDMDKAMTKSLRGLGVNLRFITEFERLMNEATFANDKKTCFGRREIVDIWRSAMSKAMAAVLDDIEHENEAG